MPYIYVYSPSDFVGGLPDEQGAAAAGTPVFSLTLVAGATPTLIEINDDDLVFDEVDASQTLVDAINLDGNSVAAGTSINTAYDLIDATSGIRLTSFHFGGDGYQQGPVDGIASTTPLTAGSTYTFSSERTSHQQNNLYTDYVACFTQGAMIATDKGDVPVEDLEPGMQILTADHGAQPVRMVPHTRLGRAHLAANPKLRPVRISAGALGLGLPKRDMLVSPQHRFLANSPVAKRMFGTAETLISAKKLTALPGIYVDHDVSEVTYYHVVLDRHEIITADGVPTESFYLGPMAIQAVSPQARAELTDLFPDLMLPTFRAKSARGIPAPKQQARFVLRTQKNGKTILCPVKPLRSKR